MRVEAIDSVIGYTIIFGIYIIGRPLRAHLDAKAEAAARIGGSSACTSMR